MADDIFGDEDHFTCPLCQEILRDPATIPCGHNFCMSCLKHHWDLEDQKGVYSCPACKQTFTLRPLVSKNPLIASLMRKFRALGVHAPSSHVQSTIQRYAGPGDVECDVCEGRKLIAVKSCLECHGSYCETHLKAHLMIPGRNHTVFDCICSRHNKVLDLFCRTDHSYICYPCLMSEHKGHDTVTASDEKSNKLRQIRESQRRGQQRIQEKEKELKDMSKAVENFRRSAQVVLDDSETMIAVVQKKVNKVKEVIRAQEEAEVRRTEILKKRVEQEIAELRSRDAELEQLCHIDGDIHFLKIAGPITDHPFSTASSSMTLRESVSFGTVKEHVTALRLQLEEKLDSIFEQEVVKISAATAINAQIFEHVEFTDHDHPVKRAESKDFIHPDMSSFTTGFTEPMTREEFMKYYCYFTLDPSTAHKTLLLSEGNRAAKRTDEPQVYSDHAERFDTWPQVLCREGVSGRCYWEVEWSGVCVSVAVIYRKMPRRGGSAKCVYGYNDQSWGMELSKNNSFFWHKNKETKLPLVDSSRIGVYVDHRSGTLAFYSISDDTMNLLHKVETPFTHSLFPGFRLNNKSSVRLL